MRFGIHKEKKKKMSLLLFISFFFFIFYYTWATFALWGPFFFFKRTDFFTNWSLFKLHVVAFEKTSRFAELLSTDTLWSLFECLFWEKEWVDWSFDTACNNECSGLTFFSSFLVLYNLFLITSFSFLNSVIVSFKRTSWTFLKDI